MQTSTTHFDLDTALVQFNGKQRASQFTIRNAVEGLQIFGGIGSGKTSGSGRTFAIKYLSHGFAGLVLTAKMDEAEAWREYCRLTGRENDLIVVQPGSKHCFNFLEYESAHLLNDIPLTDNILQVLKTVIRAGEEKSGGKSDDPFWETALDLLIYHVLELCQLAHGRISIKEMYDIALTVPKNGVEATKSSSKSSYTSAFLKAQKKVKEQIKGFTEKLTPEQEKIAEDPESFEDLILENIPDAATLKSIDQFFIDSFRNISDKTRNLIEFCFNGFLFRLLREPVYSLFCKNGSTYKPEDCLDGKIILIDLPVKLYHKVGRDCQIMFKYIFQRAMERRDIKKNGRPIFIWADEAQHFLHEHDSEFQATARSSRIATVYLTQNLPNYHANMGGTKFDLRVKAFLGTLGTKIFHANADLDTNRYASELIGDAYREDKSMSRTMAGDFSSSENLSFKLERILRPEQFVSMKSGGPDNDFTVEAYIHRQGIPFHDGLSFRKIALMQNFTH